MEPFIQVQIALGKIENPMTKTKDLNLVSFIYIDLLDLVQKAKTLNDYGANAYQYNQRIENNLIDEK